MSLLLYLIFFVSGAAALIFETLWFRQSGLAFGNSVWASSIVLASFMAGLALGNALAAAVGERVQRPIRWYAAIELTIAVTGLGLVHLLPEMTPILRPLLVGLDDQPVLLNTARLTSAFLLLLIPSTAMGFTLPVLVKALLARDPHFGAVLGRLYGWNNIGAVVGAIAGEGVLLELFGVRGTGMVAAVLDVGCAGAAIWLSGRLREAAAPSTPKPTREVLPSVALRICAAAFLAGGILLAFEVVWFRFLHLFVHGGPLSFALMLGVVLSGIGTGGFVAGAIVRRRPEADRHTALLALVAGVTCVATYQAFEFVIELEEQNDGVVDNDAG